MTGSSSSASGGAKELREAAEAGDVAALRALLGAGTPPDASLGPSDPDTALHFASYAGHVEAMRVLLDVGASVRSLTGEMGATPLQLASCRGQVGAALPGRAL